MLKFLSPLALFKDSKIAPLFIARLVSSAGVGFGELALAWGVMGLGYGPGGLSLVLACNSLPALLIIFTGVAGDRFRRHHILITAEIITCIAWLGLGTCFLTRQAPLPLLCALGFLSGIATAMFLPTIRGIIADLLAGNGRLGGNAIINQTESVGLLIGLASSGLVVTALGPGWAASTRGVLCAVSALFLSRLNTPRWQQAKRSVLRDLRVGWREFTAHRWVWIMTLQYTVVIIAMVCYDAVAGPVYMAHGHGGARAWGVISACEYAGALAGAFIGARWTPSRLILSAAALPAAGAIPMVLMGVETPWILLAGAAVLPGACEAIYYVLWTTSLQDTFTPDVLVRVNSWNIIASYALMPVTLLTAGPLVERLGPQPAALGASLITVLATGCSLLILRLRGITSSQPAALPLSAPAYVEAPPRGD
ncbi:MFS transporter [Actinomadura nitritigenes]|uniref:MFS transporter n=1 Tax=Actinomadura nitritigenes TaxID=134602 RepID=A0ABS3R3M8_9ACTN|nr:MFS transporter [Actinomadura nitritigenes]MBO2440243.1 MFS transporter [Actinomadura nitritigenes]